MAIETLEDVAQNQAKQEGQFEQFSKRVDRTQTESDNTRRELTDAIRDLRAVMDTGFANLRQDFANTQKWQISCGIAAIIALCAIIGLIITLLTLVIK